MIRSKKLRAGVMIAGILLLAAALAAAGYYILRPARFAPYAVEEKTVTKTIAGVERHFRRGSFKMRASCYLNDDTEAVYVVPVDAQGKPLDSAANIVFYAPFNGEDGSKAYDRYPWLRALAEEHGCSVYSLRIRADTISTSEPTLYYIYAEAGWYPGIFRIQEFLTERFQLPPRKLYMIGQSSGGSLIQRMAVACPERIAAGACNGAGALEEWRSAGETLPPLLLLSNLGDGTNGENRRGARAAAGTPWKVWHGEPLPVKADDKHSATPEGLALMQRFILDAMGGEAGNSRGFQEGFGKLSLHHAPGEPFPPPKAADSADAEFFKFEP